MTQNGDKNWFADGDAYEHYIGRWSRPVGEKFLDWISHSPGLRWADVGCGTGALTQTILKRADPERVIGVEPSEGFLDLAKSSIQDERVEFKIGDARSLPLDDHKVDVVVSGLVLNFIADKARALQEMRRIVKPGGTIAAFVWDYAGDMQLIRYYWSAVAELFPDSAAHVEGSQFPICKPGPLTELFRSSGLTSIETCALDTPTNFADFDDYWSPFLRGQGPAGAYCVSLTESDRNRLQARLRDSLPARPDGVIPLNARAWAVRGTA